MKNNMFYNIFFEKQETFYVEGNETPVERDIQKVTGDSLCIDLSFTHTFFISSRLFPSVSVDFFLTCTS